MKTVIHIGLHKCASTYLQRYVFPRLGNYLFFSGTDREILDNIQSKEKFNPDRIRQWVLDSVSDDHELTVLSHEELSGQPNGQSDVDPYLIARHLKQVYPNGKIILIIRSQLSYLRSLYAYRVTVKGYEYRSLWRFLEEELKRGLLKKMEYHHLVKEYYKLFLPENVLVLPLEKLRQESSDFIKEITDFCGVFDLELDLSGMRPVNISSNNKSIVGGYRFPNFIFSRLLTVLNGIHRSENNYMKLCYVYYRLKRLPLNRLNGIFKTKNLDVGSFFENHPDMINRIAHSNRQLVDMARLDLKRHNYPLPEK